MKQRIWKLDDGYEIREEMKDYFKEKIIINFKDFFSNLSPVFHFKDEEKCGQLRENFSNN